MEQWYDVGGKQRIRVRDSYVRDTLGVLAAQGSSGPAKLDLVLRGLADPTTGLVPVVDWSVLHDACRDSDFYQGERRLKTKWVSRNLRWLVDHRLVERVGRVSVHQHLRVLSDEGTGAPIDDPGLLGDRYVTFSGDLVRFGHSQTWNMPELAAYFCAIHGEVDAAIDQQMSAALQLERLEFGAGRWLRTLQWFSDRDRVRPERSVRYGFAERTLRRGFSSLERDGLILQHRLSTDPRTGETFVGGPKVLRHNGFDDLRFDPQVRRRRLIERAVASGLLQSGASAKVSVA